MRVEASQSRNSVSIQERGRGKADACNPKVPESVPTSIPGSLLFFSSTTREEKEREPGIEVAVSADVSGLVVIF